MDQKIETAYILGRQFAAYLNEHPEESQNWSLLEPGDDLPEFDYAELRDTVGVTPEIETAYRRGFNDAFIDA
jgi:hypothetical protein